MRRHSKAGGEAVKARRGKVVTLKRRNAPKVVRRSSAASLQEQLDRKTKELNESLEQQTATSEVLRVISSSSGDLKPIFAVILENATRLCQANFGVLFLSEGDAYRAVAMHNAPSAYVEARQREPLVSMTGTTVLAEVARTKRTIQVADMAKDPAYHKNPQYTQLFVRLTGARSFVGVPMLKDDALIGVIGIYRQEVRPFTAKQIELLENFAAQAVIAIENTRLLSELRQSLEQQTATADVLRVISSSPGELEPVFQAMLENATRICEAKFGSLFRFDGNAFHLAAAVGAPPELVEAQRHLVPMGPTPGGLLDRTMRTKQISHTEDARADTVVGLAAKFGGARSVICVPMLKDDVLVGAIIIYRREIRPFTDKQIALLTNFAAQAVIAIENTRLLNELRQSLEQQTATADVLQVISSSPGELPPVFQTMLANATKLCEATYGALWLCEGDSFRAAALHGALPAAYAERLRSGTLFRLGPQVPVVQAITKQQPVQLSDARVAQVYIEREPLAVAGVELAGIRTLLAVPMFKDNEPIGAIAIYRQEVRPFTDKQIKVVENFAAQAVIAIENARLLNELRESLQQQTATADVLKVISRSTFDLQTVLETLTEFGGPSLRCEDGHHRAPGGRRLLLRYDLRISEGGQ